MKGGGAGGRGGERGKFNKGIVRLIPCPIPSLDSRGCAVELDPSGEMHSPSLGETGARPGSELLRRLSNANIQSHT